MNSLPPTPRSLQSSPSLSTLRHLLARRYHIDVDIYNVTKSLFQPGVKLQYRISGRDYFGKVIEVVGSASKPQVRVENVNTLKKRDIQLNDVTGIVQEN